MQMSLWDFFSFLFKDVAVGTGIEISFFRMTPLLRETDFETLLLFLKMCLLRRFLLTPSKNFDTKCILGCDINRGYI